MNVRIPRLAVLHVAQLHAVPFWLEHANCCLQASWTVHKGLQHLFSKLYIHLCAVNCFVWTETVLNPLQCYG